MIGLVSVALVGGMFLNMMDLKVPEEEKKEVQLVIKSEKASADSGAKKIKPALPSSSDGNFNFDGPVKEVKIDFELEDGQMRSLQVGESKDEKVLIARY